MYPDFIYAKIFWGTHAHFLDILINIKHGIDTIRYYHSLGLLSNNGGYSLYSMFKFCQNISKIKHGYPLIFLYI